MKDSVDKDLGGVQTPGYSQLTLHLPMCYHGEGSIGNRRCHIFCRWNVVN